MAAYAKQAKNKDLEADAVEIRMRATRRIDEMRQAQKDTVGLSVGTRGSRIKGARVDDKPTLASQGIDKNLAHQARVLGAMDDAAFKNKIAEARASASRVFRRAVREAEIEQERKERRARTALGGSVADLHALIASGFRAGAIAVDPAWPFETGDRSKHALFEHYESMPLDEIKALPVAQLAAKDCALFLWVTWPFMPIWHEVIEAWGFNYSSLAFDWIKLKPNGEDLRRSGNGYGTIANAEPCLLARRGHPLRLAADVHSIIMSPVGAHSEKPDEAYRRMERLYGGPYLELFARRPRDGWTTWGDEIPAPDPGESWDAMWARPFGITDPERKEIRESQLAPGDPGPAPGFPDRSINNTGGGR
jgi:N6-adenosine-specific RNA methylase IME4